jgi:hypothetical protein
MGPAAYTGGTLSQNDKFCLLFFFANTIFLIVNMIIRIHPKPFILSKNSFSNRQYPGGAPSNDR